MNRPAPNFIRYYGKEIAGGSAAEEGRNGSS